MDTRYIATRKEIAARYEQWEIVGPPAIREYVGEGWSHLASSPRPSEKPVKEPPPNDPPVKEPPPKDPPVKEPPPEETTAMLPFERRSCSISCAAR
jgi:hypothetical protein